MCFIGPYLDGESPYWPSSLGGVVLSLLHDTGVAFDRIEMIDVPLVLVGSARACLLLSA
jgi:hypothetical protein